jgi:hypothetical protein
VNALTVIQPGNVPVARRALADLQVRIERLSADVEKLKAGRRRLAEQMELVTGARNELESLIAQDSISLVDRIKNSVDWAFSGFGGPRATKIAESLAASRLQHTIGQRAKGEIESEIERLEAERDSLLARKPDAIAQAMREAAAGILADDDSIVDHLREVMVQLRGLEVALNVERLPTRTVATLPDFRFVDGLPEMAIPAPKLEVEKAADAWRQFARDLADDAMASADRIAFPPVNPNADDNVAIYSELSAPERRRVDMKLSTGA